MTVYRCPLISSAIGTMTASAYTILANGNVFFDTTEANRQLKFYTDGWFSNLRCYVTSNAETGNTILKIRINGSDTAASLTVGAGLTGHFEDTSNVVTFSTNDLCCISVTKSDANAVGFRSIGADMLVATAYNKIAACGNQGVASNTTRYMSATGDPAQTTTEDNKLLIQVPAGCTVKNFQYYVSANSRSTTTTMAVRKNSADTALVLTATAGASGRFEDTSNTDSFTAGDEIDLRITSSTGTGSFTTRCYAVDLESTSAGEVCVMAFSSNGTVGSNATTYGNAFGKATLITVEAQTEVVLRGSGTVSDLRTTIMTNTASNTTNITARKNNTDQSLTIPVLTTATGDHNDLTNSFTWSAGDIINIKYSRAAGTGSLTSNWTSMLLTVDSESDPSGSVVKPWYAYAMQ